MKKQMSLKNYAVLSSLLFGLVFGAGNLIFPLHLGQLAGANWLPATIGFLVTAVALPLMAVLAIAIRRANGVYDIFLPAGVGFAVVFMALTHLTIGPFFGTPRTSTVSYTVGVSPLLPAKFQSVGLIVYTAVFFLVAFLIAYNESSILDSVGKVLNPIFLVLLFIVFFIAFSKPMGGFNAAATAGYAGAGKSVVSGFLEGYNTMDALASLAFGVTVVTACRQLVKDEKSVAKTTAKAGVFAMILLGLIYFLLIMVGTMSLGTLKLGADGGVTFSQIVQHYAGTTGQALLAALIVITCLTTAVGLVAAFAQDFAHYFPVLSYRKWLVITSFGSFLVANLGLQEIIAWSLPALMFLYPIAMVTILMSLCHKVLKEDRTIYRSVIIFTMIPAILDAIVSMPASVSGSAFGHAAAGIRASLPLSAESLSWVIPAIVGLIVGYIIKTVKEKGK